MEKALQILSYIIPKVGKEKNGDHLKIARLEEEGLVVAMVADGVSQQPTDWLASEMTCKGFMKAFVESDEADLAQRITKSIDKANRDLIVTGTKMASTLAVCVIELKTSKLYWASIGDSRIYKVDEENITCLTEDDAEVQNRLISSSRKTFNEKRTVLSKVIGQFDIDYEVQSAALGSPMIIIASDGFYNARPATFSRKMLAFFNESDFEAAFHQMIEQFAMLRGDDLSVIVIKI